jgi:hypothetical protein
MAEGDEHNECGRDDFQNNRFWRDAVDEYDNPDNSENNKLNESSPSSKGTDADLFWWFFISHKIYLLLLARRFNLLDI